MGNHFLCCEQYTFFCNTHDLLVTVFAPQHGHLQQPLVTRISIVPYANISCIVHINVACMLNQVWPLNLITSHVGTPASHNNFNSSIIGSRYTSNASPVMQFGLGMMNDNNIKYFLLVNQGGMLQFRSNSGHVDQVDHFFLNGFTPSMASPNCTFLAFVQMQAINYL